MVHKVTTMVGVLLVAVIAGAPPVAGQGADEPTVSVAAGPTVQTGFGPECNDIVVPVEEATSFIFQRVGEADEALTVSYEVSGSATAGEHYEALPGQVTFAAGASSTTVDVEVLAGESTELVELRLGVVDGQSYRPGEPASAAIEFVRPRDPSLPPPECGFYFAEGGRPIAGAIERTIDSGATPERIVVMQVTPPGETEVPAGDYRVQVTDGSLPPELALGDDGRFSGTATEAGTFEAQVEACRTTPPGTCTTATLLVTVRSAATTSTTPATSVPTTPNTLPATGITPTSTAGAGVLLVVVGLSLAGVAARPGRRRPVG